MIDDRLVFNGLLFICGMGHVKKMNMPSKKVGDIGLYVYIRYKEEPTEPTTHFSANHQSTINASAIST
jgi:hypothetical protein